MAGNPAQADQPLTSAPGESPEVKLQNLEREVDLIKTSIKRLLMDIRERMNEVENPFTVNAAAGGGGRVSSGAGMKEAVSEDHGEDSGTGRISVEAGKQDREGIPAPTSVLMQGTLQNIPQQPVSPPSNHVAPATPPVAPDQRRIVDEQLLAQFKAQLMGTRNTGERAPPTQPTEKSRLQKVYKLFKWTSQAVRKYGHDRLEIMLQSYKTMGYISKESSEEIREIARLMPANIGDEHEVGPDEFVSELYTLNRIIAPDDTTLDRDMIEVMMEQRSQVVPVTPAPSPARIEFPVAPAQEKKPAKEKDLEEDWMDLPDRI